ncbi:hypothetical protein ABT063_47840 [Streptomyces sp. NPDC002838]|uniref:hypothetical protein n=1 Tax=Streptomyces sp. NPDC002838 TaxID=3154436 RepID=UPI003327ED89
MKQGAAVARVVVVHGVGKQLDTAETLHPSLAPALIGGVNLALRADARLADTLPPLTPSDVVCAGYGDLFRRPGSRSGTPQYEAEDVADGLEYDLLLAWWKEAARLDPSVLDPTEAGRGLIGYTASRPLRIATVRRALDALTRTRFFKSVSDAFLIAALKQFRRYFEEPRLRAAARKRVLERLGPGHPRRRGALARLGRHLRGALLRTDRGSGHAGDAGIPTRNQ